MATRRWKGGAAAIAQVNTHTIGGTAANGQVYTVTINGRDVAYTASGSDTNDTIASALQALLAVSTFPEFREVAWSVNGTVITGTASVAGRPFTATSGATGTGTFVAATPTACTGPNYWSNSANWLEGAVPVDSDDVTIDGGPSILYGLDQSSVLLTSLRIGSAFLSTSEIGLPNNTSPNSPSNGYPEYRDQRLKIGATALTIETSSRRIRLDLGTDQTTATVLSTGTPPNQNEMPLDIIGTHASNVLRVLRGQVGVAYTAGDTAQFNTIEVSYRTQPTGDAVVRLGSGLTLATLLQSGGQVAVDGSVTTVTKESGALTRTGSGTVGTLGNYGGDVVDEGTGTITQMNNSGGYYRRGLAALTVTNATLYGGSSTEDENGTITWANPVEFENCRLPSSPQSQGQAGGDPAYVDFGRNRKLTVADI